jgi:hypothetical protein
MMHAADRMCLGATDDEAGLIGGRTPHFFGEISQMGGSRFATAGPRDVRDGRWLDGRRARMVAVDVAIARRGRRDVAGWSM